MELTSIMDNKMDKCGRLKELAKCFVVIECVFGGILNWPCCYQGHLRFMQRPVKMVMLTRNLYFTPLLTIQLLCFYIYVLGIKCPSHRQGLPMAHFEKGAKP